MASFWIQVVGWKDTGKTSLLEGITRELTGRGRTVAYIKHTHVEPTLEAEDTDTARMRAAGAAVTALTGDDYTIAYRSAGRGVEELSFRVAVPGDIVLAEGFKKTPGKKVAIASGDLDILTLEGVVAVVGEPPDGFKGPSFTTDQTSELCDLIEKLSAQPSDQTWATRLLINGKEVPLNPFVQDAIASALSGMTDVLRDVDEAETLEIRSRRIHRKD
ncbi:MAG: molybdopterin-guanine dinucleotide biosynthesis protein B [Candidatus Eisenbacteria sp.]|nr:molybdopterin-guanine dinucleotide biosynthesis protein B [Candidatus Eisenbacteria bacterium]